jgi:hypothetical protein
VLLKVRYCFGIHSRKPGVHPDLWIGHLYEIKVCHLERSYTENVHDKITFTYRMNVFDLD